jgi:hypothetical protein
MNQVVAKLDQFHKTRNGYIVFGLIELALLYGAVSIAIDTANMWVYLLSIILLVGVFMNIIGAIRTHGRARK